MGWDINGNMNKKLLHKTAATYLVFSILILLVAAPLFYYVTRHLYIQEADDTLVLHKKEFIKYSLPGLNEADIAIWNKLNRNVNLSPAGGYRADSIYSKTYYDTLEAEHEPYRELLSSVELHGKPYTYMARINLVESEDLMISLALLFVVLIIILLVGLFIISNRQSKRIWKPFYTALEQMESFEIDKNKTLSFSGTDIEEFNRLNNSIKNLIEKNTAIYKSQREFIDNAAHELQTPLAVFQAKIDNIIQGTDITEEQSEILGSIHENISRLNRLNKNLLLLSNMEEDSYHAKQPILLNTLVEKQLDFFREQATAKNITIVTHLEQPLEISSNPVLAEILVNNLFLNAIRHNIKNGQVQVSIQNNQLIFSNTGAAGALDSQKLFKRFSKNNPSGQGTGLGLSIIKRIAQLNGWTVNYIFTDNLHLFSVQFA